MIRYWDSKFYGAPVAAEFCLFTNFPDVYWAGLDQIARVVLPIISNRFPNGSRK